MSTQEYAGRALPINSRDFELLETLKWNPSGGYVLLERHWQRLRQSAEYFRIPVSRDEVLRVLADVVDGRGAAARVRLLVGHDGGVRCEVSDVTLGFGIWDLGFEGSVQSVLRAAFAAAPVSRDDIFLYHKTTHRDVYDRARASRPDVDAVLLWNDEGEVTESTDANVVVEIAGRRVTPPVACGLLPGTMRAELLERGEIAEAVVDKTDLSRANRVWLINSVRGWMDVELV